MTGELFHRHGCNRYLLYANFAEAAFVSTLFLNALFAAGIVLHFAGAVLLHIGSSQPEESREEGLVALFCRFSFAIGAFLPIFGIPGMTLLVLSMHFEEQKRMKAIDAYHSHISSTMVPQRKFERINILETARQELDVEPVVDLLTTQDRHLIWGSIEALSRLSDETSIGMIRRTLKRQDMDVKFYSAWGLDRIDRRFRMRRKKLEDALETDFNPTTAIELLDTIHHAVKSRFYEGPLLHKLAEDGVALANRVVANFPENAVAMVYHALFYSNIAREDEARVILHRVISNGTLPTACIPDAAELFFRNREFDIVRKLIQCLTSSPENEVFLVGHGIETSLDDLRLFWLNTSDVTS